MDYILTENYIIDTENYNIIKYTDILSVKKKNHLVLSGGCDSIQSRIYIVTKDDSFSLILSDLMLINPDGIYTNDLYEMIKQKNPKVKEN